ncbi:MAG: serine/threonine protein kinase [Desulfatibacillum sp.]|nr:serine/threonine protein kinase [Desulfatibacillum sp.]
MTAFNNLIKGNVLKNRYRIETVLGSGHSSVVYKALDSRSDTHVALKIMDPLFNLDSSTLERFLREVRILQPINHPNIVTAYDVFETKGFHCIAMELVRGLDGKAYLKKNGPMPFPRFLKVTEQLLEALASCHDKGIVHRDIKPQNLVIDDEENMKLLDFGIAKMNTMSDLTKTGTSLGTPEYMAPEIFQKGASFDPRVDIYATGLVLHEFLTGKSLFQAQTLSALFQLHRTGDREPVTSLRSDLPDWIDSVIAKCLEPDPANRYQSVYELQSDLKKNKMAAAHLQKDTEPALCNNCRARLVAHVPFCCQCGAFAEAGINPGEYSLIVQECGEQDRLAEFLAKTYKKVSAKEVKRKLGKPPVLVASGLSKDTAHRMAADLSLFPCKYLITTRLSQSFRLPDFYAALGLILPLVLMLFSGLKTGALLLAGLALLLVEVAAYSLFRLKTRPLINIRRQGEKRPPPPRALVFAKSMQKISTPRFKNSLAHVLSKYFRILEKASEMTNGEHEMEALDQIVEIAFKSIETAQEYLGALDSTSLAELKEREFRLSVQIDMSNEPDKIEKLIKMKTECMAQMRMFREMEDRYQGLLTSVIQASGALQRYEDSLRDMSTEGMLKELLTKMDSDLGGIGD